jgi:hypothetical protein
MISRKFQMKQKTLKEEVQTAKVKIKAEKKLQKAEIPAPKSVRKKNLPDFPEDITEIPDKELGYFMGAYEAQAAWIKYCISRREIDYEHGKLLLDFIFNKFYSKLEGTATERKSLVEGDIFYVNCKMEFLEIEADLKLLRASLESYERYSKSISREISSRGTTKDFFPKQRISTPTRGDEIFHDHNK